MRPSVRFGLTWIVAGVFLFGGAVGCGDPAEEENQENAGDGDGEGNGDSEVDVDSLPQRCDTQESINGVRVPSMDGEVALESEYDMRMTTFQFTSTSPGRTLNSIISLYLNDQSANFPIVVLLQFEDIDQGAGTVSVRGGAGLKADNDGNYLYDDELEFPAFVEGVIDADGNIEATLPILNFVATIETEGQPLKTVIPIRDLELRGQIRPERYRDCAMIFDGSLEGVVVVEEVEDVRVQISPGGDGVPLSQVLRMNDVNYDYSGDGTNDSWRLSATYDASDASIVE